MRIFKTFYSEEFGDTPPDLTEFKEYVKRPIPIWARQMQEEFQVESLEGNYAKGKPGDYLMCGIKGELYICDQEIFKESYDEKQGGQVSEFLRSREPTN